MTSWCLLLGPSSARFPFGFSLVWFISFILVCNALVIVIEIGDRTGMATLLSAVALDPSGNHFGRKLYGLTIPTACPALPFRAPETSSKLPRGHRNAIAVLPASSRMHIDRPECNGPAKSLADSPTLSPTRIRTATYNSNTIKKAAKPPSKQHDLTPRKTHVDPYTDTHTEYHAIWKSPAYHTRWIQCPKRARTIARVTSLRDPQAIEIEDQVSSLQCQQAEALLEPFPDVEPSDISRPSSFERCNHDAVIESFSTPLNRRRYRRKLSEASSNFVHTVKTASFSNDSFSVMPLSTRVGRSSESQHFMPPVRCSLDSDRPLTSSSIDEAAFFRGVRRKHIVEEFITTEESYVADLKALVYLYSTLLASTSAIPQLSRQSIQRNVTGLLRLHERLVDELHQVRFRAAARKWADPVTPIKAASRRHARWRSADAAFRDGTARRHRRTRSSIGSSKNATRHLRLGTADPADVLDLAATLLTFLPSLLMYEEYCANHEIVAHELQRKLPSLWSTYEAGMESLASTLSSIDQRIHQERKGLTVGDLLIKPIQRICKYPLLVDDLLQHTPVFDSPGAREALGVVAQRLREVVQGVNTATDSSLARQQIQRRWLLQDRLNLQSAAISPDAFRDLGRIHLCGVLFVTYQTATDIKGCYALCILFDDHVVIAFPGFVVGKYDVFAVINLADARLNPIGDGKGLQCQSAFHTFKLWFLVRSNAYEILLSACSPFEEDQWISGLEGRYRSKQQENTRCSSMGTYVYVELKTTGRAFHPNLPLERQSSIQRAVTVGNRGGLCHIILRNTHNAQDLHEYRTSTPNFVNRSRSHASTNKIVILAPKRSERTKLETSLSDVWTRDQLPFPGMIASRGTQILRASAGSLARKLSLASIHGPFSKKPGSTTASSKRSYDTLTQSRQASPTFEIRRPSFEDATPIRSNRPREVPELDTMDGVVGRMIGGGSTGHKRMSFSGGEKLLHRGTKKARRNSVCQFGPSDPAAVFYTDRKDAFDMVSTVQTSRRANRDNFEANSSKPGRKKRWSNPFNILKGWGGDNIRDMLLPTK